MFLPGKTFVRAKLPSHGVSEKDAAGKGVTGTGDLFPNEESEGELRNFEY